MIEIDGIIYNIQRYGGITVYSNELLKLLEAEQVPHSLSLLGQPIGEPHPASPTVIRPYRLFERYRTAKVGSDAAIFHSTYYRTPRPRGKVRQVVTVHDFIYERFSSGLRKAAHSCQKFLAVRSADAIICVSSRTADDLKEFIGPVRAPIHVIHNGVSDKFRVLDEADIQQGRRAPFVLYVGQRAGYKNFARLVSAMAHLPVMQLICVGGPEFGAMELREMGEEVTSRLQHLRHVSEDDLNLLYNQAHCLVYPSTYEGFGIPVVEAMRAGCPVVCGPCEAVIEVGGDALLIAEGEDVKPLVQAIRRLSSSERNDFVARGLLRSKRYSWSRAHANTLEVYRTLL